MNFKCFDIYKGYFFYGVSLNKVQRYIYTILLIFNLFHHERTNTI